MGLPFLPYGCQTIEDDDVAAVAEALRSDYLTTGPGVAAFERAFADLVGAEHAVAVSNGTAALHATCAVADLGPSDEVIVPAMTFLASANCARYVGAEPVFADVDPDTGLTSAEYIRAAITPATKAIIPVHLTGRPVELAAIAQVAAEHDLVLIEDAAHALGASYGDTRIGDCAHSSMTIFSLHPVKHITTGEGGVITTNDAQLAERLRTFRCHGMVGDPAKLKHPKPGPWYYEQHDLGYNYRITDFQCALGLSQLKKLDRFVSRRRHLAARYNRLLADLPRAIPVAPPEALTQSAYHLYPVLIDFDALGRDRATVMAGLREAGIGTQVHYIPVASQPYYTDRGASMDRLPGAQRYYERTLSLPLYPRMADTDVDRVIEALRTVLHG